MRPLPIVFVLPLGATAACSQPTVPSPVSAGQRATLQRPAATSFRIIHNFGAAKDGERPESDLAKDPNREGIFYGTTVEGGSSFGTVFEGPMERSAFFIDLRWLQMEPYRKPG